MGEPTLTFVSELCPIGAPFMGFMGVTSALVFSNLGAAYGTAKAGIGIASMGVFKPDLVMKNIIPVVMAGVLGIYGLICSVIIVSQIAGFAPKDMLVMDPLDGMTGAKNATVPAMSVYTAHDAYRHLAAGLTCGLSGLAAGFAIGVVGDAGVRSVGKQEAFFVPSVLMLIFAEALALYGLIVGLILGVASSSKACQFNAATWTA